HRSPAVLAANGGHWKGLDDLELATCGWVAWFNEDRIHGELDDLSRMSRVPWDLGWRPVMVRLLPPHSGRWG
ncbi:MAG: hypothetical protein KDB09_08025, partial [Acidimicrobiales bacterium]|nr:hypothetical protein [Acidimicrobiales bacterium]